MEYLTGRTATAHNGNITNAKALRVRLSDCGLNFAASSDSEVISLLIAYKIMKANSILEGVTQASPELEGAFSLVILSSEGKLIAVRDSNVFRPLCIGENEYGMALASEHAGQNAPVRNLYF